MKLFLKKSLVTKNVLSPDGVLAYVGIRKLMDANLFVKGKTETAMYISVNSLAITLIGGQSKYERVFTDALQNGIKELCSVGVLTVLYDLSTKYSYEVMVDLTGMYLDVKDVDFMIIFDEEVKKILLLDEVMKKKISMLKYFIALIGTIDWSWNVLTKYRGKISHMPQSFISELADISERSCQRYNEVLVNADIIYVYKSNDKIKYESNNSMKQINNCYSRYQDRVLCEEYAKDFEEEQGYNHNVIKAKKKKEQADNNRRLAQIYNRISSGIIDYDEDTIRDVYKYVSNKNKALKKEIDPLKEKKRLSVAQDNYLEKLQKQVRDLSCFEQFPFLFDDGQCGEADSLGLDIEVETLKSDPKDSEWHPELPIKDYPLTDVDEWIFDL